MTSNVFTHPIVAGVDGSSSSLRAAHWAADEATRRRVPLRLVYAANASLAAYTGGFGSTDRFLEALNAEGRLRLTEVRTEILAAHPGADVQVHLDDGAGVPSLLQESKTARLVVLGSRGLGGFTGMLVGSTAVALVAHGHCPVAVIRGRKSDEAPPSEGPVVVGVDGSPASEAAVAMAFDEASSRGAELVAVHTWIEFSSDREYSYARQFLTAWDDIEPRESEVLAERLAGWQEKYPEVTVRRVVTRDRPVRCLLEHAENAQLLVVGSRGRGGFAGMLQGSTSQALLHYAPCPLLVVRPDTMAGDTDPKR
jgi:nucleotide-binding universal stress UspA family protein